VTNQSKTSKPRSALHALYRESIALFVDDATLAVGILVWTVVAWFSAGRLPVNSLSQCALFLAGFLVLLAYSAVRAVR
jgi:ABC-type transport system involved in cytochrome c biogenesis permease subunit